MRIAFGLLQLVAAITLTGILTIAGAVWTGATPSTAVYARNWGFATVGLFAVPTVAVCLVVKLQGWRGAALTLSRAYGQYLIVVYVIFMIFMVAGVMAYPYAPIKERKGDFQDKLGRPYSYLQYERFTLWESSFGLVAASMLVGVLGALPAEISKRVRSGV